MKTRNILFTGLVSVAALLSSCNDFQEINEDPNLVGEDKVKPQWFRDSRAYLYLVLGPCFPFQ